MAQQSTTAVALRGVAKHYEDFIAVHPMHLDIAEASFVTFLGPSGCGKTTTLRMIAGLASVTAGEILIRDRRINDVPIHKRNLGLVFQNYALFPHKTVYGNVAFGLKYRDVDKAEIRRRVTETLELVQLPHTAERMPGQLSGGQQQRIALARAIVIQPDVLLLDEPLSALDANLREDMRVELKRIQRELGVTTFFVTHDQSEALAMSDQVVVMNAGRVEQIGTPQEVYDRPASEFVANFLGHSNILDGRVAARDGTTLRIDVAGLGAVTVAAEQHGGAPAVGRTVKLTVRAEKLWLGRSPVGPGELTQLEGTIQTLDYQGQGARYFVRIGEHTLQAINTIDEQPLAEGAKVPVYIRARDCVLLPDASPDV